MRGTARLAWVLAEAFVGMSAQAQTPPTRQQQVSRAREDALDPSPVDPATDPHLGMFLNDWRNSKPRRQFGGLLFRDILTKLDSSDPIHPRKPGAVLTAITAVSYVTLDGRSAVSGRQPAGQRQIYYVTSGEGKLTVNGKSFELRDGVGFTLSPDFDFKLVNTGTKPLSFYVRSEPLPPDTKPSSDVVVVDRFANDRRIGAHWVHTCNGGPQGMTLCTIAAHTMPQPHSHAGEEAWIMVKGETILTLGKNLVRMKPGQAYKIPPTGLTAHSNINMSDEPVEMIYMGPAVRAEGPAAPGASVDFGRLDNSPIAPNTASDVDMFMGDWMDAYPRIAHGNLYVRDMLTGLQGADPLHPTRKGAVLQNADAVSYAMLEPRSTAHSVVGELKGQQEVFVVHSGSGALTSGLKTIALSKGMSFIIRSDSDFRLTAFGNHYMTFYVITEKLTPGLKPQAEVEVIDHRTSPSVPNQWHDRDRPVIASAEGLSQFRAVTHVDLMPMAMARPYSAAAGTEEIWIATDGDVDMLFGKQLRHVTAGTAYKIPPTGITAHANINLNSRPAEFLNIIK